MPGLSEEQAMVRDAAADWVGERAPVSALRKVSEQHLESGYDPALYAEMAQMGWTGILIPERYGGSAFGCVGMGLILEQLGRQLVASPLLDSAIAAASALVLGGSSAQCERWLPGIVSGDVVAALAVEEGARHAPEMITTMATRSADGWRLDGIKRPVSHGFKADLLIVAARIQADSGRDGDTGLFVLEGHTAGVSRTLLHEIAPRGAAVVECRDVRLPEDAWLANAHTGTLDAVLDRARACLAMEMLGAAQQAFATTLDYLKVRVQFGQLIGAFQALQHRMAALYGELELTRSAVMVALRALDADDPDCPAKVSLAKALAGETARKVSAEAIQLHGGIGMTEEHDAGLYFKHARICEMSHGDAAFHRERYARARGY